MIYGHSRSRRRLAGKAVAVATVALLGWSLAMAGSVAQAADKGDDDTSEQGERRDTGNDTKSSNDVAPGQAKKQAEPAQAEAPRKIVVRKYVQAPPKQTTMKRTVVASSKPTAPWPKSTPPKATAPAATATPVVAQAVPVPAPVEQPAAATTPPEPVEPAPAMEDAPELALADTAVTSSKNGGPDLGTMVMLAASLSIAVVVLAVSTAMFHRFGAVGAHGRAVEVSWNPVSPSRQRLSSAKASAVTRLKALRTSRADDAEVTSAHFAKPLDTDT